MADDEKTRDQLIADLNQLRTELQTCQEKLLDMERSSRKTPLKSLQNKGTISAIIDVPETKVIQEDLRQSEERYRTLFENMLEGFAYCKMLFDEDGHPVDWVYLNVNQAFYQLTGLENVVGKKVTEVIPGIKEAHPELFEAYGRVSLTSQPENLEIFLKPLGIYFRILVFSPSKEHFVAVFENITERKGLEEQLTKSEEMFRVMVEKSPLAMIVSRAIDESVEYLNPKFTELFGYTMQEVPDIRHWWPLAYPDEVHCAWVASEWNTRVASAKNAAATSTPTFTS